MGRRARERKERIIAGEEMSIAEKQRQNFIGVIKNPLGRALVKRASIKGVKETLMGGSTEEAVANLDETVKAGGMRGDVLKRAIMAKAPKEMDKGICRASYGGIT